MMSWARVIIAAAVVFASVGCGQESGQRFTAPTQVVDTDSTSGCGTISRSETLSGAAINGVTPSGRATATMYPSYCGRSNSLLVSIKNVNYPDGTVVNISLDWSPIGTITLSGRQGSVTADLGKFAVSNDEVRVAKDGKVILIGPYFR